MRCAAMQDHLTRVITFGEDAGDLTAINDYCRCDVLDTYFVFLRSRVLLGKLTIDDEHCLVSHAKEWLEAQSQSIPAFQKYLSHWGDWKPPTD